MNFRGLALAVPLAFLASAASAASVYEAPGANVVGGLCPTCSGTATKLGDDISLASGPAKLKNMIWDTSNFGADYDANIQVQFFSVDTTGSAPAVGGLLHTIDSTHFLTGGNGSSSRTFVDIDLGGIFVPERLIYSIEVLNNNGSTNWNVAGQIATTAGDEDPSLADADVGTNNENDFFFGDWNPVFGADPGTLLFQRLSMDSYQLGLAQNQAAADFSNLTPNVVINAAVPIPAALPLVASAIGLMGLIGGMRRRRTV